MSANNPEDAAPASESETNNAPETPAQKLDKLKSDLEKAQSENADIDRKIDTLKSTITELTKAVTEIDQKTTAWEKAAQTLSQQRRDEETYHKNKKAMLLATVPNKEFVIAKKQKGEQAVTHLRERVKTLHQKESEQTQQYAAAKAETEAKRLQYDGEINLAQRNDAWLKDLAALHAEAEKEDEKNNVSRMFFLILEIEDVLKKLDIPSVQEFTRRVNEAQAAASKAADYEQAAKEKLAQTQADLKKTQKELSDAVTNRRKSTLDAIPENTAATVPS